MCVHVLQSAISAPIQLTIFRFFSSILLKRVQGENVICQSSSLYIYISPKITQTTEKTIRFFLSSSIAMSTKTDKCYLIAMGLLNIEPGGAVGGRFNLILAANGTRDARLSTDGKSITGSSSHKLSSS